MYWGELDWKGRRAGCGVMVWQEDSVQVYSGSWAQDRPEGRGKMWWGEGAEYTGEWAAGRQHGPGVLRRGDTEIRANFRSELSCYVSLGFDIRYNSHIKYASLNLIS